MRRDRMSYISTDHSDYPGSEVGNLLSWIRQFANKTRPRIQRRYMAL